MYIEKQRWANEKRKRGVIEPITSLRDLLHGSCSSVQKVEEWLIQCGVEQNT